MERSGAVVAWSSAERFAVVRYCEMKVRRASVGFDPGPVRSCRASYGFVRWAIPLAIRSQIRYGVIL